MDSSGIARNLSPDRQLGNLEPRRAAISAPAERAARARGHAIAPANVLAKGHECSESEVRFAWGTGDSVAPSRSGVDRDAWFPKLRNGPTIAFRNAHVEGPPLDDVATEAALFPQPIEA